MTKEEKYMHETYKLLNEGVYKFVKKYIDNENDIYIYEKPFIISAINQPIKYGYTDSIIKIKYSICANESLNKLNWNKTKLNNDFKFILKDSFVDFKIFDTISIKSKKMMDSIFIMA